MVDQASKSPESVLTGRSQPPTSSVDRSLLARKDSVLSAAAARNTELPMKQKEKGRSKRAVMFFLVATLVVILIAICASITVSMQTHRPYCTKALAATAAAAGGKCPGVPSACRTARCRSATTSWRNEPFRSTMLDRHNLYRQLPVNGSYGADMIELEWDEQLEDAALRWLQHLCAADDDLTHDAVACRQTPDFDSVGQNLWLSFGEALGDPANGALAAMQVWHNELAAAAAAATANRSTAFSLWPLGSDSAVMAGRAVQMIWSRTFAIGCAYVSISDPLVAYRVWVGCNYAPAGGYLFENVFVPGAALGTDCPPGTRRTISGLCKVHDKRAVRKAAGLKTNG